ncbi:extracellular solute-binding protein [Cohnella endophytica]|uniref:Extracellular solute-binding protein n=1 Tax=Cohnella endophytica TaxID=2419778 RepID=A0A494Y8J5_9BACL|nr:ABC transporter substrate-binding protein [Cohnella endophytica]RKP56242.1 extracellular solute-binding protein [Cohnella endophytica]
MKKSLMGVSALLISTMLFASACSSGGNDSAGSASNAGASSKPTEKSVELTVAFPIFGAVPKDMQVVQDEINKITQEKINATVKLMPIGFGDWQQQTNLMLTSNEKLDLMAVFGTSYSNMVAKGQLVPLDEQLEENGQGIKSALEPDYLNAAKINGNVYAVPTIRDLAVDYGILMRKDLLDKNNIDAASVKTLDDVERVLKTVKGSDANFTPLIPGAVGMTLREGYVVYDDLGDSIGVLPDFDNGLKVVNLYETQEYADFVKRMHNWYKAGYILKDAATNKTTQFDLIKANKGFAYMSRQKPGFETVESKSNGQPMVAAELLPPVATTSSVTSIMWGVPVNSVNPDKATAFLNLLFSDKDVINLLDWGVEGKDYVKKSDGVIDFPEGVDASNSGYNLNMGWLFGNQFLSYVFNGDDPDLWTKMDEFNKSARKSKALGFIFDVTPVKTEYAAVSNVITQYKLPIEMGSVDPDKILPEFISKLKSAGIDKIIAAKQQQLNEWAKANSVQ